MLDEPYIGKSVSKCQSVYIHGISMNRNREMEIIFQSRYMEDVGNKPLLRMRKFNVCAYCEALMSHSVTHMTRADEFYGTRRPMCSSGTKGRVGNICDLILFTGRIFMEFGNSSGLGLGDLDHSVF